MALTINTINGRGPSIEYVAKIGNAGLAVDITTKRVLLLTK